MPRPEKPESENSAAEQESFAARMQTLFERIRSWTKGEGLATVQLPGQSPKALTIDDVRRAKTGSQEKSTVRLSTTECRGDDADGKDTPVQKDDSETLKR